MSFHESCCAIVYQRENATTMAQVAATDPSKPAAMSPAAADLVGAEAPGVAVPAAVMVTFWPAGQ